MPSPTSIPCNVSPGRLPWPLRAELAEPPAPGLCCCCSSLPVPAALPGGMGWPPASPSHHLPRQRSRASAQTPVQFWPRGNVSSSLAGPAARDSPLGRALRQLLQPVTLPNFASDIFIVSSGCWQSTRLQRAENWSLWSAMGSASSPSFPLCSRCGTYQFLGFSLFDV